MREVSNTLQKMSQIYAFQLFSCVHFRFLFFFKYCVIFLIRY